MSHIPTLIIGACIGFALAARPGDAYRRLIARTDLGHWRGGVIAAWPGVTVDVLGFAIASVGLLLWSPRGPIEEGLLLAPLITYLLARGWRLAETPGTGFVQETESPEAGDVLLKPLRRPWLLALRLIVSFPAAWLVSLGGPGVMAAFAAGYVIVGLGLPVLQAWLLTRRRAPRPYVLMPETARVVMASAALVLFVGAFGIVAAMVLEHGGNG